MCRFDSHCFVLQKTNPFVPNLNQPIFGKGFEELQLIASFFGRGKKHFLRFYSMVRKRKERVQINFLNSISPFFSCISKGENFKFTT